MSLIAKSMLVYQIGVGGDTQMRIPQLCTCCLSPTDSSERLHFVNTKRTLVTRDKTYTFLNMPLCPSCKQHRKELTHKKYLAIILSILAGFLVFISLDQQLNLWLRLWLFVSFTLAGFFVFDKYFPLSRLDKKHATHGPSVAFAHVDTRHNLAILNFANKEYTKLLCNANQWTYSQAESKSELRKYTLIIIAVCVVLGLMFQNLKIW